VLASFKLVLAAFWDAFSCTVDTMHSTHKDTLITSTLVAKHPRLQPPCKQTKREHAGHMGWGDTLSALCGESSACACLVMQHCMHIDENFIIFLICEEQCHCSMKAVRHGGSQGMGR
jgi:hypothetical protein